MGSTGAAGSKARSGRASNSPASVSSVKVQNGNTITLEKPLQYGVKDNNIPDPARLFLESWEKSQDQASIEHIILTDDAGNVIATSAGTSQNAAVTFTNRQALLITTLSHNHPRQGDLMGGTFSTDDIKAFTGRGTPNLRTLRATASEGTYSISKGANFNNTAFRNGIIRELDKVKTNYNHAKSKAFKNYLNSAGKMTWAQFQAKEQELFNGYLVRSHNVLIDNQSKYDYTYTLEPK